MLRHGGNIFSLFLKVRILNLYRTRDVGINSAVRDHVTGDQGFSSPIRKGWSHSADYRLPLQTSADSVVVEPALEDAGRRHIPCKNSHSPGKASLPGWGWARKTDSHPSKFSFTPRSWIHWEDCPTSGSLLLYQTLGPCWWVANNLTSLPAPLSTTCNFSETCKFFGISSVWGLWCGLIQKRPRLRSLQLPACSRTLEQVTELPWTPDFFPLGLPTSLHCSKELGWNEKSIAMGDPLLGQISCFCLWAWRPWVGRPVQGTLPEPALGWQVQAVSTLLWCVWGMVVGKERV